MFRVFFTAYAKKGMSADAFFAHYLDVHVPIARTFPKLRSYDIYPLPVATIDADPAGPAAFAVMSFDSQEDFEALVAGPEFAEAMADNESFVDHSDTYFVGHIPVVST